MEIPRKIVCSRWIPQMLLSALVATLLVLQAPASDCTRTSVGFMPLTDLGAGSYQGHQGGLYPKGSNTRPPAHEAAGLAAARAILPLNSKGQPDDVSGKIALLSIGMSNTTQEFSTFKPMADADPDKNPRLVLVDGAQGGMTASIITNPEDSRFQQFWKTVDQQLAMASASPLQVQVAWIKEANAQPHDPFPIDALTLKAQLAEIARILKNRFPNIRIAYYSSRIYAGYASSTLNPEPFAYQSGFSVKWLIEEQMDGSPDLNYSSEKGTVRSPWLSWGPYLWADGLKPRSDGLTYACADLNPSDGTHPASGGAREKVAHLLLDFLKTDSTSKPWFLRPEKGEIQTLLYPALVPRQGNPFDSSGSSFTGLAVANLDATDAALTFTAFNQEGSPIAGSGITNPKSLPLSPGAQLPRVDYEIFGSGFTGANRASWFQLESTNSKMAGFFEIFNGSLSILDGIDVSPRKVSSMVFPDVEAGGFMEIHIANPNQVPVAIMFDLAGFDGVLRTPAARRILEPHGALTESLAGLFPQTTAHGSDYLRVTASAGVCALALLGKADMYVKALKGLDMTAGSPVLCSPQYAVGGGWRSSLAIVNLDPDPGKILLALYDRSGQLVGTGRTLDIEGAGKIQIDDQDFFVSPDGGLRDGYVLISSSGIKLCGSVSFGDSGGNRFASELPLVGDSQQEAVFSQLASDSTWYTGLAMVNPHMETVPCRLEVYDSEGNRIGLRDLDLEAGWSLSQLLTEYIPALSSIPLTSGYFRLTSGKPIASFAVYGSRDALSAVPPQIVK